MPTENSKHDVATSHLLGALGLAARARQLVFGTTMICEALRSSTPPRLVLVADDVSENTRKKITDKCAYYQVKAVCVPLHAIELAAAVGKKSDLAAVALRDKNFCHLIESALPAGASQADIDKKQE